MLHAAYQQTRGTFYVILSGLCGRPHKEERFMFVVFPLLCVAAAISCARVMCARPHALVRALLVLGCGAVALVSLSRSANNIIAYRGATQAWAFLAEAEARRPIAAGGPSAAQVCVGKEWYRFSSSFFLPTADVQLQYLRSSFGGLLPQPFAREDGTRAVPSAMNAHNREERRYALAAEWESVASFAFMDASRTRPPWRWLYVPYLSDPARGHAVHAQYHVLKRRRSAASE
jgi:alpha-1,2-mannosyltransferase